MKQIIVGVDGSEQSKHAVRIAADIAGGTQSELLLVHVCWPVMIAVEANPGLVSKLEAQAQLEGERQLEEAALLAGTVPVRRMVTTGGAAERLADLAENPDVWLAVVGSRGRGAATRVLMGSTSDRLVHIAPKPVLVTR